MTPRQRIIRIMRGEPIDIIPWFPRLDLWYNFHKGNNTLPPGYDLPMDEIIKKIGAGIYNRGVTIYKERLKNLEIEIEYSNPSWRKRIESAYTGLNRNYILRLVLQSIFSSKSNVLIKFKELGTLDSRALLTKFKTPHGSVSAKFLTSETLHEAKIRPVQSEYFIKDVNRDLESVKYIINNIELEQTFDNFTRIDKEVGEDGVVWAEITPRYSPMHQLIYIYMGMEQTFIELYDHKNEVEEFLKFIEKKLIEVHKVCLDSPADFIAHGGNFDSTVIGPKLFEKYFLPYFSRFAQELHTRNKFLVVHIDGEMKNLMDIFPRTNSDIAEGFTPAPMTEVTFHDAINIWGGKVVIWGGIPSTFLSEDTTEGEFCGYIQNLVKEGRIVPFVLSMGDNTPINADIKRLEKVTEIVESTRLGDSQ